MRMIIRIVETVIINLAFFEDGAHADNRDRNTDPLRCKCAFAELVPGNFRIFNECVGLEIEKERTAPAEWRGSLLDRRLRGVKGRMRRRKGKS